MILTQTRRGGKRQSKPKVLANTFQTEMSVGYGPDIITNIPKITVSISLPNKDTLLSYRLNMTVEEAEKLIVRLERQIKSGRHFEKTRNWPI